MKKLQALFAAVGIILTANAVKAATFAGGQLVETVASTATAAGTTTLVLASPHHQRFTGSTTQTVVMPSALTLKAGMSWVISNDSSGTVTVQQNGGSTIGTLIGGEAYQFMLISAATPGGTWDAVPYGGAAISSLTGDVTATGPGAAAATIAASSVTSNKILDDTITNADINSAAGIADTKLATISTAGKVSNSATTATASNTMSAIMARDSSGQVAASTFTGNLVGNVTGDVTGNASTATALAADPADCGASSLAQGITASGAASCRAVDDAAISSSAAITRSKLASGSASHVVINDGSGNLSSEAALAVSRGGTNIASYTAGDILYASGSTTLSKLAAGTATQVLKGGTTPSWGSVAGGDGVQQNLIGLDSNYSANYTTDRDAETSVGNWTAYADAAGTAPVDMTGGSPNTTCTRVGASTMNGAAYFLMTVSSGATRQGEGCSDLIYIPPAYRGGVVEFAFPFTTTGTITEDDIKLYAYDVTNSTVITPTWPGKILGAGPGRASAVFSLATNTAQVRVGLHIARASNTGAVTVLFDDVSVSPQVATYGLAGSNAQSYTPTLTGFGTASGIEFTYWRTGQFLNVQGKFTSGTSTATEARISLPSGLTAYDATLIASLKQVGGASSDETSAGGAYVVLAEPSVAYVTLGKQDTSSTGGLSKRNGNSLLASGEKMSVFFSIPVSGWDANVSMASSSTFKISTYLASGSRVTGSAPTSLGQYRSYLRNGSAATFTETNGNPTATPSVADGIKIYNGNTYASADTNNEPTKYEIFVGKNKNIRFDWYSSAARTGFIDTHAQISSSLARDIGYQTHYDPSSGIVSVVGSFLAGSGRTAHSSGVSSDGNATIDDAYFDIIVSENALAVGVQAPRSECLFYTGNGSGATNTKIRHFTTVTQTGPAVTCASDATNGASMTVNEDGVYSLQYDDVRAAGGCTVGLSLNSTQLTTNVQSITAADILDAIDTPTAARGSIAVYTGRLRAGNVVRPHHDGACDGTGVYTRARITKVAN